MAGEPDDVDTMVEPVVPSRHRWLAGLLGARPGDRAADLGCGTGGTLAQAAPGAAGPGGPEGAAAAGHGQLRPGALPQRARGPARPRHPGRRGRPGAAPRRPAGAGPQRLRHPGVRLRGPGADPPAGPRLLRPLAGVLVGLQVNEARGDDLRAILWARTRRLLDHLEKLGAFTLNRSGFPIVEVPLADVVPLRPI